MGFFGIEILDKEVQAVEIPQGWQLRLCNAVLKPKSVGKDEKEPTTVYIQVGEEEEASGEFALCQVSTKQMQCQCSIVLADVDSPVYLSGSGPGAVHLTGCFEPDPFSSGDSDSDSEGDSEEGSEDEMAMLDEDMMEDSDGEDNENLGVFAQLLEMVAPMGPTQEQMEQLAASYNVSMDDLLQHLTPALDADGQPRVQLLDDDDEEAEEEQEQPAAKPSKKRKLKAETAAVAPATKAAVAAATKPAAAAKPADKHSKQPAAKAAAADKSNSSAAAPAPAPAPAAAAAAAAAVDKPDAATIAERRKQKKLDKKRAAEAEKAKLAAAFGGAESEQQNGGGSASGKTAVLKTPSERRMAGGLRVIDKVLGAGKLATPGKQVKIFYEGSFPDGKVFDKNYNRKSPLTFRVGLGDVIKGMDRGMEGMRVGGQRELIIPSGLGYGKQGAGPIGPNQDLVFHVELLDVSGR